MDTLWDLPQNYADQLVMLEYLAAMREQLTPYQQETLERFLIRSMQGFLLRAPRVLSESECRQLFERCRALYWGITSESIARSTNDTRHRLPYLALHFGDFDLFYRPAAVLGPIFGREADLYVDYPGTSWALPLTKVTSVPARIEGISMRRRRERGRPRAVLGERDSRRTAGEDRTAGLVRAERQDPSGGEPRAGPRPGRSGGAAFSVTLDPREFPAGTFPVRLVLCTRGRNVSRPCGVSPGVVQQPPVAGFHGLTRIAAEGSDARLVIESTQA